MIRYTASKRKLASKCLYLFRDDAEWTDSGESDAARMGNAFGEVMNRRINDGSVDVDKVCEKFMLTQEEKGEVRNDFEAWREKFASIPRVGWFAELAFAYDYATGESRQIGMEMGRDYEAANPPLSATEIPGSVDLFYMGNIGGEAIAVIWDWKRGFQRHLDDAETNGQLALYALMAAKATGVTRVKVCIWRVLNGEGSYTTHDYGPDDFERIAEEILSDQERIMSDPEPCPGPHCRDLWCPAQRFCPALNTALVTAADAVKAEVVPGPDPKHHRLQLIGPIADGRDAQYRLQMLKPLKSAVEQLEKQLKEYAELNGGIRAVDGSIWGPVVGHRESIKATPESLQAVEKLLGPGSLDQFATFKLSKAALNDAIKKKGLKPYKTHLDGLLENMRGCGAISNGEYTSFEYSKRLSGPEAEE